MNQLNQNNQQNNPMMAGYNPPNAVEMQPINKPNVDILKQFFNRVPVETFYKMCPIGQDGQARTDANRARLMVAKFRGISPTDVSEYDEAIAYFENLTINELKMQLQDFPDGIYSLLKGPNWIEPEEDENIGVSHQKVVNGKADFLVDFCEKVNLKQIYGQLENDTGMSEPRTDTHHARIMVANLRNATFGMVQENDPGVRLLENKSLVEIRVYLSNLPMNELKQLDINAWHQYDAANPNQGGGGGGGGGFQFPTINLNYNGDVRQFQPPKFGCFDEIMGFIMNAWPHLNSFKLMYQDQQSSWIRITTNIDVQECIRYAVETKADYLSINIIG